jgi:hypothetical protein
MYDAGENQWVGVLSAEHHYLHLSVLGADIELLSIS